MSTSGLEGLDHSVQLTHAWINDLDQRLSWNNKPRAYRLLRATLHTLRDWLQLNDAAHLGAQLPQLLRGAYYEQWRPAEAPPKKRSRADFVARVQESFKPDPLDDAPRAVMAVFELLSARLSTGEVAHARHALPEDLRALWPEPHAEPGAVAR